MATSKSGGDSRMKAPGSAVPKVVVPAALLLLVWPGSAVSDLGVPSDPVFCPAGVTRPAQAAALIAKASVGAYDLQAEKNAFLLLINQYRQENGLGPLALNDYLQNAAQWMSADMADKDYFSHTDSLGRSAFDRMAAFGYAASTYKGENIAAGYATAASVMQGWKASPGHNANMLNTNYRVIGIGLAYDADSQYGYYWTTDFGGTQTVPAPTVTLGPITTLPPTTQRALAKAKVLSLPNPAGSRVTFLWDRGDAVAARVDVYHPSGEQAAVVRAPLLVGRSVVWDAPGLPPGVYFYRLKLTLPGGGTETHTGKLVLAK